MKVDLVLLRRIHESIHAGKTGNPDAFAKKLGISRSLILKILKLLKEEFNAPIDYSEIRKSYHYREDCEFYFGVVINRKATLKEDVINAINKAAIEALNKAIVCMFLVDFMFL